MKPLKAYIGASWNQYSEKFDFSLHGCDMTDYGYHTVKIVEIEAPPQDDEELRNQVHKALMAQKAKILADAWVKAQEIQETADKLLALPAPAQKIEDDGEEIL